MRETERVIQVPSKGRGKGEGVEVKQKEGECDEKGEEPSSNFFHFVSIIYVLGRDATRKLANVFYEEEKISRKIIPDPSGMLSHSL